MKEEMMALETNETWDLVPLLVSKQAIGCKWVYIVKVITNGFVACLKANLVAKRYAQTNGVDYIDTFPLLQSFHMFTFLFLLLPCIIGCCSNSM